MSDGCQNHDRGQDAPTRPTPESDTGIPVSQNWKKWLPQLQEAMNELNQAKERLKMSECEVSRICYCLQRDERQERSHSISD